MPHLSLSLLGTFQAALDGQPLIGFATNKVRALLAYLVVECERPHSRETLAGLLWSDLPNRAALSNLRYALSNLRETIHDRQFTLPFLLITRDTIQFNVQSDYSLDVATLPQQTTVQSPILPSAQDGVSNLQTLVSTYRGRFLEGFACNSAPFEEWVLFKREQIDQQVLRALRQLTAFYDARGEYDQAQIYARKQIELEPWDEQAHRQLMHALACLDQRSAALAQYETCRRLLKQELGVAPSHETTTLYENIRDGKFDSEAQRQREKEKIPLTHVPIPLTSFIGRQNEIAEIKRLIKTTRLLTLAGAGGCGKTRLAIQVATDLANTDDFSDGVWWIDLAALDDPGLVPQTVASVFGLHELPDTPILHLLLNDLRSKVAVLVLDNCEHLVDACARVTEPLLSACPHLQIMVTSRQPLGIDGEVVWRVPSLAIPDPNIALESCQQSDAIQLFNARAATVVPDWEFAANKQAIVDICTRLDGIPLAIELAVARLGMLSVEQIAARLGDRFDLLTGGSRTALPRHQTLRATMDWSYDLLSKAERALLRRLSVFVGGFTLQAAEAMGNEQPTVNGQPLSIHYSPLDLLASLIDQSLVVVESRGNETRYRLLETVRQYALKKLNAADEAEWVRRYHVEFFVKLAEEAESQLRRVEQAIWLDRLELEHDNLRAALAWSLANDKVNTGLRLAGALGEFWHLRGYLTEGRQWLKQMLTDNPSAAAPVRAKAILQAGFLALQQGTISQAHALAEESLTLNRELKDTPGIAGSLLLLGIVAHFEGNNERATNLLEESRSLFQQVDDRFGYAYALLWMARGQMRRGETDQAMVVLESSLAIFQELGDMDNISFALGSLGDLARRQGDYARATNLRKESLRLAWKLGSRVEVSYALEQLAMIASVNKETERAIKLWGATEVLRESLNRSIARSYEVEYNPALANVRAQLGRERFAVLWAEGRAMTTKQAVDYALNDVQSA